MQGEVIENRTLVPARRASHCCRHLVSLALFSHLGGEAAGVVIQGCWSLPVLSLLELTNYYLTKLWIRLSIIFL